MPSRGDYHTVYSKTTILVTNTTRKLKFDAHNILPVFSPSYVLVYGRSLSNSPVSCFSVSLHSTSNLPTAWSRVPFI